MDHNCKLSPASSNRIKRWEVERRKLLHLLKDIIHLYESGNDGIMGLAHPEGQHSTSRYDTPSRIHSSLFNCTPSKESTLIMSSNTHFFDKQTVQSDDAAMFPSPANESPHGMNFISDGSIEALSEAVDRITRKVRAHTSKNSNQSPCFPSGHGQSQSPGDNISGQRLYHRVVEAYSRARGWAELQRENSQIHKENEHLKNRFVELSNTVRAMKRVFGSLRDSFLQSGKAAEERNIRLTETETALQRISEALAKTINTYSTSASTIIPLATDIDSQCCTTTSISETSILETNKHSHASQSCHEINETFANTSSMSNIDVLRQRFEKLLLDSQKKHSTETKLLEEKINHLSRDHTDATKKVSQLESHLAHSNEIIQQLRHDIAARNNELSASQTKCNTLEEKNAKVSSSLKSHINDTHLILASDNVKVQPLAILDATNNDTDYILSMLEDSKQNLLDTIQQLKSKIRTVTINALEKHSTGQINIQGRKQSLSDLSLTAPADQVHTIYPKVLNLRKLKYNVHDIKQSTMQVTRDVKSHISNFEQRFEEMRRVIDELSESLSQHREVSNSALHAQQASMRQRQLERAEKRRALEQRRKRVESEAAEANELLAEATHQRNLRATQTSQTGGLFIDTNITSESGVVSSPLTSTVSHPTACGLLRQRTLSSVSISASKTPRGTFASESPHMFPCDASSTIDVKVLDDEHQFTTNETDGSDNECASPDTLDTISPRTRRKTLSQWLFSSRLRELHDSTEDAAAG